MPHSNVVVVHSFMASVTMIIMYLWFKYGEQFNNETEAESSERKVCKTPAGETHTSEQPKSVHLSTKDIPRRSVSRSISDSSASPSPSPMLHEPPAIDAIAPKSILRSNSSSPLAVIKQQVRLKTSSLKEVHFKKTSRKDPGVSNNSKEWREKKMEEIMIKAIKSAGAKTAAKIYKPPGFDEAFLEPPPLPDAPLTNGELFRRPAFQRQKSWVYRDRPAENGYASRPLVLDSNDLSVMNQAWVTLATNDRYALGAMVLATSLSKCHTNKRRHCLITSDVTDQYRLALIDLFDHVTMVDPINSNDKINLTLLKRPELGIALTKLHCWTLIQYETCVFLDADTLMLSNCDELFNLNELSAAPDYGWPDSFNSGVFVFKPSMETYNRLLKWTNENGSFDGADQGVLNSYFKAWRVLPSSYKLSCIYNCCSSMVYTNATAYKQFGANVKIIHFLGEEKPWHHQCDKMGQVKYKFISRHCDEHMKYWWKLYHEHVSHKLSSDAGLHEKVEPFKEEISPVMSSRFVWESGNADYMGKDKFENVQHYLDKRLDG